MPFHFRRYVCQQRRALVEPALGHVLFNQPLSESLGYHRTAPTRFTVNYLTRKRQKIQVSRKDERLTLLFVRVKRTKILENYHRNVVTDCESSIYFKVFLTLKRMEQLIRLGEENVSDICSNP